MSRTYQEPLVLLGSGLFGDEGTQAKVDTAFEAFKQVCERDGSPVGLALRERYEVVLPDFAKLWRSYDDARKAEERAVRVSVKPEFVALGVQIDGLRGTLSGLSDNRDLHRYFIGGLRRQIGMPARGSREEAKALIERVTNDLDTLSRVCRSEAELQHQPGEREDTTLVSACERMRQLILDHGGVRVPKSIALVKGGSFGNAKVEVLYHLMRCIDPKLTPSQVKTALQKLLPLAKAAKNQN